MSKKPVYINVVIAHVRDDDPGLIEPHPDEPLFSELEQVFCTFVALFLFLFLVWFTAICSASLHTRCAERAH